MKKFFNLAMMIVFALVTPFVLVACSAKLESIKVDASAMKTEYVKGETVDLNGIKVTAYYSDNTNKEVDLAEVEFSTVDTSVLGEQTLTVTYQEKSCQVTITVYNSIEDSYTITGFEAPQFVRDFKANIKDKGNTTEQNETEFFVNESVQDNNIVYLVGDDNAFKFLPEITALDENRTATTLNAYKSSTKVYLKEGTSYTELTDNLTNYVAVNNETSTFDFTDAAVGKEFKIEVKPFYIENAIDPDFNVTFEFKVVDGFNVHNEYELSIIDNINEGYNEMKAKYGTNVNTNAAILHNNLVLEAKHTAPNLYYQEGAEEVDQKPELLNSLIDYSTIYERQLKMKYQGEYITNEEIAELTKDLSAAEVTEFMNNIEYETFKIEANFFTVDATAIPLVEEFDTNGEDTGAITHSNLFSFMGYNTEKSVVEMNNFNVIGNANKAENTENAGGLIFAEADKYCTVKAYNSNVRTIAIAWFCSGTAAFELDSVKTYDCFSNMFYLYQNASFDIKNSELKRCGGPVIIANQEGAKDNQGNYPVLNVDENTIIESLVTGEEAWFGMFGSGTTSQISFMLNAVKGMDAIFTGYSNGTKSILNDNKLNLEYVLYDVNTILDADQKTQTEVVINYNYNDGTQTTTKTHILDLVGTTDPTIAAYRQVIAGAMGAGLISTYPPILQSNGVTLLYMGDAGVGYIDFTDPSNPSIVTIDNTNPQHLAMMQQFVNSGKLNIVINGTMALVTTIYDVVA